MLEADPNTDWSKVNLEALRQHLIDMNEVTLKAEAVAKPVDGGIEVTVTGAGEPPKPYSAWSRRTRMRLNRAILMGGAPRPNRCRMAWC